MYGIGGTDTTRLSSKAVLKSPWFHGWGTNLQNIEKSMRKIYKPDEGKGFCQEDQAGAEAKIVAYLCRAGRFRQLFEHGIKPHVFVALHLFPDVWEKEINKGALDIRLNIKELIECPISELKNHPYWKDVDKLIRSSDNWPAERRYYYISKQVCHSSNYGIKAGMFSLNTLEKSRGKVVISKQKAEEFLSIYHGLFPEIREWHREVIKQVEATGYLYTLQGYPLHIQVADKPQETDFKKWFALVPQATVAQITRIAYVRMFEFIVEHKLDWDLLADTHDSYLQQCPVLEMRDCAIKGKEFLEQELTAPRGEKFRMGAEASIGFNWGPWDEVKNPEGLKEIKL